MNIIEIYRIGKKFRRPNGYDRWLDPNFEYLFSKDDILSEDWEIEQDDEPGVFGEYKDLQNAVENLFGSISAPARSFLGEEKIEKEKQRILSILAKQFGLK